MSKNIRTLFFSYALIISLFIWMPGIAGADAANSSTGNKDTVANGQASVPSTEVDVTADKDKAKEGSTEAGYKPDTATTTGPWGKMKLQDTPYSINVMSSDLIENVQASNQDQLAIMNPVIQFTDPQNNNNIAGVMLRGFYNQTPAFDGLTGGFGLGVFTEEVDRVEVLTGPSGFLYGMGNVGGLLNYVYKRPTQEHISNITVGDYGGSNSYIHGDFGGPIDNGGKLAYRMNVVDDNGGTQIDNQSIKRQLLSGALDWHAADNLLLQFNGGHQYWRANGRQPYWGLDTATNYHSAPDASKLWAPNWTYYESQTNYGQTNLTWNINNMFTFRAAYRDQYDTRRFTASTNWIESDGTVSMTMFEFAPQNVKTLSQYYFLDANFNTGAISHKLTMGFSGYNYSFFGHTDRFSNFVSDTISPDDPDSANIPMPSFTALGTGSVYKESETDTKNWLIGDDVKLNDKWSSMIGINHAEVNDASYTSSGATNGTPYDSGKTTPSVSFIYKPDSGITTYATYMEALEEGVIVPDTNGSIPYTNAGQVLSPVVDKQYEVGIKQSVGKLMLTTALFDIKKANYFSLANSDVTDTYVEDGAARNRGVEFTVSGKATDRLTLYGGLTLMQCTVEDPTDSSLNGTRPTGVANQLVKLYAEYDLPNVPGLTLTGGVYWIGSVYDGAMNTAALPGVVIGDIGLRYKTAMNGTPVIYRFNVTNVTNKNYWTEDGFLGEPRAIAFSMEMKL